MTAKNHLADMEVQILWSTRDLAQAIAALRAEGPLPCRTVLVPRERVAHALRRELLEIDRADALAGTRFVTTLTAAAAVLDAARIRFSLDEPQLRPIRLRRLFDQKPKLEYFDAALLCSAPGWDEAFAFTIARLEDAGLGAAHLRGSSDPRLRDVAAVWSRIDAEAGDSWTPGRLLSTAAETLGKQPEIWPFDGPVLATVPGDLPAAAARFLRALPATAIGLLAARPLRERYVERMVDLFGERARALFEADPPRSVTSEKQILTSFFLERPDLLASTDRPRSNGRDGTVELEEYAGVEAEIEAATDWVGHTILERKTPLSEIAVLAPYRDPLLSLIADRLGRLPWTDGSLPVYVAGGSPAVEMSAGARILAVVRALARGLAAAALAEVLPALRTGEEEGRPLSHGAAVDLVYSLGTAGGNAAYLEGGLEWAARAAGRVAELERQLERARQFEDDEEQAGLARNARDLERLLRNLRAVRPPLDALAAVAETVCRRGSLAAIWPRLATFIDEWVRLPGDGKRLIPVVEAALEPFLLDPSCAGLAGVDALQVIERALCSVRLPSGRFGDAAVYVGTIEDAVGLPFRAVRVIGLAEGQFPSLPQEDPVLPDAVRAQLTNASIIGAPERAIAQLHALDRVIRDARETVVLSASRMTLERTIREPSSIFIEAAAAIGRPNGETKEHDRPIPDMPAIERDYFSPARIALRDGKRKAPLTQAAWLERVAASSTAPLPASWRDGGALDLDRIHHLRAASGWSGMDGIVRTAGDHLLLGLTPERPISASALKTLLECPHHFLLERVLGYSEPASAPPLREIDMLSYGALLHRVAERFSRQHGTEFGSRQRSLADWLAAADPIVEETFEEFCKEYPLVGAAVRAQQRNRLRNDFRAFLESDWNDGRPRRFVATEKPFGHKEPIALEIDGVRLYLRGFIDRIDVESGTALIRDLKSGKPKPRSGALVAADHIVDLQIGVYALVTKRLAAEWDIPSRLAAAYTYADARAHTDRAFAADFDVLESAAEAWLGIGARLLNERAFPRTPNVDHCKYCGFRYVCEPGSQERAAALLGAEGGLLREFLAMKTGETES